MILISIILDQLWKYSDSTMKLINKLPELTNDNKQWKIPLPGTDANIEDISSGKVLGLRQKKDCSYGSIVQPQLKGEGGFKGCPAPSNSQKWLRSDGKDWFTLKNLETGKLLGAKTKTGFDLTGTSFFQLGLAQTFNPKRLAKFFKSSFL